MMISILGNLLAIALLVLGFATGFWIEQILDKRARNKYLPKAELNRLRRN